MRLIDADALREEIDKHYPFDECTQRKHDAFDIAKSELLLILEKQPTADVKPVVRGVWEERKITDVPIIEEWQSARCNKCGLYHTTPYMYHFSNYKFCPNCGASMVRGET